ncbi:hypothetical protein [Acetobacter ascendens]|uniref:Uncharacterized protein n=1 Tax=Acetobacter ascendens TaxID=481146 RepID=A0A1Y0V0Q6_9PROT|nr:hypothetical protein [Acetobacter ascendens]ARW09943.1 hypothetical protein S101447_00841 [Acetobacter ascendens]
MEQNRGEADSQQNGANASDDQSLQKIATSIEAIAASTCKSDAEKLEEKTEKDRKAAHDKKASYLQAGSVFISSVAVGLSIVGILISSKQMSIANKALGEAAISAGAASISARAATKSSEISEEAFTINFRPYLSALPPSIITFDNNFQATIIMHIKNVGNSPANVLTRVLGIDNRDEGIEKIFQDNKNISHIVMEKNEDRAVTYNLNLRDNISNTIYLKSQMIYLGIKSKKYAKDVCAIYQLKDGVYKMLKFCDEYNSDDEYK